MPLTLDDRDVLPVGFHDATIDDLEECFGRWDRCDRRPDLFLLFKKYVGAVRFTGWPCTLIVDGSFVMRRVYDPDDIDVIAVFPQTALDLVETDDAKPFQINVIEKGYCKRTYKIDLKACSLGSGAYEEYITLFTKVSMKRADRHLLPADSQKGLVRVVL